MPFAEGENIGPYRIMERLGQGGMATVYKAYHAALDRYVAIKVLHPAFHGDHTFTGRFQREARVVAKLEHPSIVPIYDYAEHEKRPYLVMKYIEGETHKARLSRGPLNAAEINQVVEAVGSALAYAHRQGILHRDVKPSNVLISNEGQMYLADFGLARIAQAGESTLSTDSIMGTPQYISPEQARGDKDLDSGTDIYSLGVMLYELVVGQVPFSADTPFSIIHDHIYTPLPMPRTINNNVPESVERVLLKTLAKERADRYEDVSSLVQAFKAAWDSAGVPMKGTALTLPAVTARQGPKVDTIQSADVGDTVTGQSKKKKRSPWPFIAAGVLLTICCIFVFYAFRERRRNQAVNQPPAPTITQVVQVTKGLPPTRQGAGSQLPQQGGDESSPEVREAKRFVDARPEDPYAQLDLAVAYWDAGIQRKAYETLNLAAELANGDQNFLMSAGEQFHMRQAWIASAAMYLRFYKQAGPGGHIPEEVFSNFHEAVFMAAPQPELEITYPLIDEILRVDQPIGLVAQARHAYYNGKLDEGRVFLNQAKRLKPDLPEASLLEGEFAVIENRYEEAKLILNPLSADLGIQEWIRVLAEDFITRIP